jgi:hypothetical protein
MATGKKTAAGREQRLALLRRDFPEIDAFQQSADSAKFPQCKYFVRVMYCHHSSL